MSHLSLLRIARARHTLSARCVECRVSSGGGGGLRRERLLFGRFLKFTAEGKIHRCDVMCTYTRAYWGMERKRTKYRPGVDRLSRFSNTLCPPRANPAVTLRRCLSSGRPPTFYFFFFFFFLSTYRYARRLRAVRARTIERSAQYTPEGGGRTETK